VRSKKTTDVCCHQLRFGIGSIDDLHCRAKYNQSPSNYQPNPARSALFVPSFSPDIATSWQRRKQDGLKLMSEVLAVYTPGEQAETSIDPIVDIFNASFHRTHSRRKNGLH